jgi:hypothetical protein
MALDDELQDAVIIARKIGDNYRISVRRFGKPLSRRRHYSDVSPLHRCPSADESEDMLSVTRMRCLYAMVGDYIPVRNALDKLGLKAASTSTCPASTRPLRSTTRTHHQSVHDGIMLASLIARAA